MRDAERDLKIESRLIPAINRERGPAEAEEFLDVVLADRRDEVIGIGLDYLETGFPPAPYAAVYARARAAGLKATAHAGESGPAENIRDSITLLGCARIDHGYHIVDDAELVASCRESRIGFTCCPSTTAYTTIFRDLDSPDHPIRGWRRPGSTSSSIPTTRGFPHDAGPGLRHRRPAHGRAPGDSGGNRLNGIRASWLDDGTKARRLAEWGAEIDAALADFRQG